MKTILEFNPDGHLIELWNDFIKNHPMPHYFQSPDYFQLWLDEKGSKPFLICVYENEHLIATLCGVFICNASFLKAKFTGRILCIGGTMIKSGYNPLMIAPKILKVLNEDMPEKPIYTEFRMPSHAEVFHKNNSHQQLWYNIFVDIKGDENDIFRA